MVQSGFKKTHFNETFEDRSTAWTNSQRNKRKKVLCVNETKLADKLIQRSAAYFSDTIHTYA